jgi:hypothetical protein
MKKREEKSLSKIFLLFVGEKKNELFAKRQRKT